MPPKSDQMHQTLLLVSTSALVIVGKMLELVELRNVLAFESKHEKRNPTGLNATQQV